MKIALAADHAGFAYKDRIAELLRARGADVHDFGTHDATPVDYPDYGFVVGEAVGSGRCDRGVLVCGSSLGIAIAANKVPGVRCAAVTEPLSAELSRRHNDANVLALSERLTGWEMIERLVDVFLATPFDGGRHARRTAKLDDYGSAERAKAQADLARGAVDGAQTFPHHDVGGQPNDDSISREQHAFAPWEVRVDAMMRLLCDPKRTGGPRMTVDELRRGIEALPAGEYRTSAYYEKWIASLTAIMLEKGVIARTAFDAKLAELQDATT